jgi:hypothetical protein
MEPLRTDAESTPSPAPAPAAMGPPPGPPPSMSGPPPTLEKKPLRPSTKGIGVSPVPTVDPGVSLGLHSLPGAKPGTGESRASSPRRAIKQFLTSSGLEIKCSSQGWPDPSYCTLFRVQKSSYSEPAARARPISLYFPSLQYAPRSLDSVGYVNLAAHFYMVLIRCVAAAARAGGATRDSHLPRAEILCDTESQA